ncbi:MAG: hypothetical protein K2F73_00960 [Ruminococcus sp.]|nr:hypothetical protein [Ruminococcus sp.]
MNKNELKDDIKNALNDLKDDYTTYAQRDENFQDINSDKIDLPKSLIMTQMCNYPERLHWETKKARERASLEKHFPKSVVDELDIPKRSQPKGYLSGFALFKVLFPQIAGFIIGCAFARMFNFVFVGYVIMGVIFAFLVGVHKSTYNDKIALKYAVIKNIVLMLIEIALILLCVGIYGIIYMIG